jgi:predicted MPP superfamily phosphohydrolase
MAMSRRTFLQSIAATGVGALAGTATYGYVYERHALTLIKTSVAVTGLPPALAGLRIGLLTDLHRSQWVTDEDIRVAVRTVMAVEPDLIVLVGDYVTWGDRRYAEPAAEALSELRAPHGVFAVLGNHDDERYVPAALAGKGIEVLRDARTSRLIRNERLEIAGIRFWTRRPSEIAAVVRGTDGPIILLAHDPRRFNEAVSLNVPLVLAGHTHGGQVVLPMVGALAARKFPVVAGTARTARTTMFVSRGVGTVYVPIRLNCPPDVAVLTLQPTAAG